jgi:hypothetical protein
MPTKQWKQRYTSIFCAELQSEAIPTKNKNRVTSKRPSTPFSESVVCLNDSLNPVPRVSIASVENGLSSADHYFVSGVCITANAFCHVLQADETVAEEAKKMVYLLNLFDQQSGTFSFSQWG